MRVPFKKFIFNLKGFPFKQIYHLALVSRIFIVTQANEIFYGLPKDKAQDLENSLPELETTTPEHELRVCPTTPLNRIGCLDSLSSEPQPTLPTRCVCILWLAKHKNLGALFLPSLGEYG